LCDTAAFHCQQAIEKMLKGFLTLAGKRGGKTHSLEHLGSHAQAIFPEIGDLVAAARGWSDWVHVFRYPEVDAPPEPDEAESAPRSRSLSSLRQDCGKSGRQADQRQGNMARSKDISVEALRHQDKRRNIPTAELEPVMDETEKTPIRLAYARRNRDLDPQLVWRGKDEQDWSDLIVQAPPLYIQEKVHPKVLIDDLLRQSKARREEATPPMPDLFADFNGLPDKEALTEFYQHDANWSNRLILGDSLSVMASLAKREGLRGKVQCIYIGPPYGIRFNSNFPVVDDQPRRQGRQQGPHHPRARTGQSLSRHLARRHPLLPDLSARPPDRRPRPAGRQRLDLRADRRGERSPGAGADGRGIRGIKPHQHNHCSENLRFF
jgi:hypothetical protein